MAATRSNRRSIVTGLAGSAAVLLIAAFTLTHGRARADTPTLEARAAQDHRLVHAKGPPPAAEWLRRLLSRSDLKSSSAPAVEPGPRRG